MSKRKIMIVYVILELFILGLCIDKRFYYKHQTVLFFISAIAILFIFCFRSKYVGADTPQYINFFLDEFGFYGDWKNPAFADTEHGFLWFCKLLRVFTSDERTYLIVYAFVVLLPIFYVIRMKSGQPVMALLALFAIKMPYTTLLAAMRQSVAISLLFLAAICLEKDIKYKKFIVCAFLITSIWTHNTMLLIVVLIVGLSFLNINVNIYKVGIVFTFLFGLFFGDQIGNYFDMALSLLSEQGMQNALHYDAEDLKGNMEFVQTAPLSLMCLCSFHYMTEDERKEIYTKCMFLACCFFNVFNGANSVVRLGIPLLLLGFVTLFPKKLRTDRKAYYLFFLFMAYFTWRAGAAVMRADLSIPGTEYKFMWN